MFSFESPFYFLFLNIFFVTFVISSLFAKTVASAEQTTNALELERPALLGTCPYKQTFMPVGVSKLNLSRMPLNPDRK